VIYQLKFLIHFISNIDIIKYMDREEVRNTFIMFNHNLGIVYRLNRRIEQNIK
jgi:hypothetical protein